MVHMHKIQAAWEATVTTLHIDGVWGQKDNGAVEILVSALKGPEVPDITNSSKAFQKNVSVLETGTSNAKK